ncbi:unnamed protein product [Brassica oleracea var. botrytis]
MLYKSRVLIYLQVKYKTHASFFHVFSVALSSLYKLCLFARLCNSTSLLLLLSNPCIS